MNPMTAILGVGFALALGAIVYLLLTLRNFRSRFSGITDAEKEAGRIMQSALSEKNQILAQAQSEHSRLKSESLTLQRQKEVAGHQYSEMKSRLENLSHEVQLLEENIEDISFGLYKPHFSYDTPEEYKTALEQARNRQKEMIRAGHAAGFKLAWTVGGSQKEGERMQKQYTKLLLRAFNGECDAAVANVSWNNVQKMEERIRKAFESINELGGVMTVSISPEYLQLKVSELQLEYEYEAKRHAVAEEQRRIKEQMREEEKAQRELERAQEEAQAEEARYQKALDKARVDLAKSKGEEHRRLTERLLELEAQLAEAHMKKEKVKAMAELTRAGYVYIISNIGSFGEKVFKIGLTRRLDPMDRVKELGDASVPFPFDVHAMVYSEDAPALENELHCRFADRNVNLLNIKKEFFYVTIGEIKQFMEEKGLSMYFTQLAEAREYRETLALRASSAKGQQELIT